MTIDPPTRTAALVAAGLHVLAFTAVTGGPAPRVIPPAPVATTEYLSIAMPNDPPPPDLYQEAGPQAASAPQAPQIEETPRPVAETAFTVPAEPPRVSPATALTISTIGWEGPLREGGTTGAVISSRLLDNTPRARSQRPPQFPFEARHAGLEGHVLVEFTVDETGHVLNPCVLSSNDARFDAPTLAAIGAWRFEPGRRDGRIVRFRMQVPVDFKLSEE